MKKKDIHGKNDLYLLCGEDLNKMIAITSYIMKIKPSLNEGMMNWLSYLNTIEPHSTLSSDSIEEQIESMDLEMTLDEIIWGLGMNLPSWDDDLPDDK